MSNYISEQVPSEKQKGVVEVVLRGAKGDTGSVVDGNVVDDLNTDSDIDALSARQGTVLDQKIEDLDVRLTTEENKEVIDVTARANATSAQSTADNAQGDASQALVDSAQAQSDANTANGKADFNASSISALDTRLTTEENKEVVDVIARNLANTNSTDLSNLIQDLLDIQSTYAAMGNTLSDNTGNPNTGNLLTFNMTGTDDELLTPPISPQPTLNPDLNGYIPIPLTTLTASGYLEDSGDGGLLVLTGGKGFYTTPQAWLTMSSDVSNNNVGFIFGIHRGNEIYFSQRITQSEMSAGDDTTNVSGGGFVDLEEGDKLYVYGSAERTATVTLYDCNLGLTMRFKRD